MCVNCVRTSVDITKDIPRVGSINHCKGCGRWLSDNKNANSWVEAGRESRELLAMLLRRVKATLSKNQRLVDASFIWTEPHSKRIRVKVSVQQEIQHGAVLEQSFQVEFTEAGGFCNDCHRAEAKDFWKCVVQVRQKRKHKKTFLYLEQLILKHEMHKKCIRVTGAGDGLDFFFPDKQTSRKFLEFLMAVMPIKYSTSQKLISHDVHTSSYNYKYTTLVELPVVSKDDVICVPKSIQSKLGNIGPLVICQKVTTMIHLLDFQTLDYVEISKDNYWRQAFNPIADRPVLKEYMVVETEPITPPKSIGCKKSKKHELADLWIIPTDKLGSADSSNWISTRTHLGKLFNAGDLCLGFDIKNSNITEANWDNYLYKHGLDNVPDVVVLKKSYGSTIKRNKRRTWKLKRLDVEETESRVAKETNAEREQEMLEFLNEVEEDPEFRDQVNIYKDHTKKVNLDDDEDIAEDAPEISVAEMLEDLNLETVKEDDEMES